MCDYNARVAYQAVYIRAILAELGFAQLKPTILKMDSSSAIDLANDPVMHATSKHIARTTCSHTTRCIATSVGDSGGTDHLFPLPHVWMTNSAMSFPKRNLHAARTELFVELYERIQ